MPATPSVQEIINMLLGENEGQPQPQRKDPFAHQDIALHDESKTGPAFLQHEPPNRPMRKTGPEPDVQLPFGPNAAVKKRMPR